jgi:hypothetical protein
MKSLLICIIFLISTLSLISQNVDETKTGSVSFISSQNIYVQFVNTEGIRIGDTLFISNNNRLIPALLVDNLSSISCIGKSIGGVQLSLTNKLFAKKRIELPLEVISEKSNESMALNDLAIKKLKDTISVDKEHIDGRFSVSSYSNFSTNSLSISTPNYRLRYNLALNVEHIANSKLSFENYMSYTHTLNNPLEKYKDFNVYNLALRYNFNKTSTLSFGRKINVNTANIGAVDGVQFEKQYKNFVVGVMAGSRPNDSTYGFDLKLFEYGAFISNKIEKTNGSALTTVAFFNQTNKLQTDRRYIYLQHSNALLKNVDFFGSAEIDLYSLVNNVATNNLSLTSTYLSIMYRPARKLSLSLSYDARKNVYYYATYKNKIDSTLEKETRQGLRFRFNYRPFKYFSWGGNAGYRLHTPLSEESMNAISYLTYSKIPLIDASLTINGTALQTANISGFIYGASMSKSFIDDNLSLEFEYRKALIYSQDIAELSLSWNFSKGLIFSADFEATKEQGETAGRIFFNISKRF